VPLQIDLKHINQNAGDTGDQVEVGIDLREYYPSVEWDILGVPAERHEKYYPCCAEPYPGKVKIKHFNLFFLKFSLSSFFFFLLLNHHLRKKRPIC
jgi:hypothetical protein